jgi:LAS superfamily LD-carboxypeptidase LdcB
MKQTAVEWLIQELRGTDDKGDFIFQGVINSELIDQAKEMEKQQGYSEEDMKKAFNSSSLTNMLDVYDSFEEFIEQFKNK